MVTSYKSVCKYILDQDDLITMAPNLTICLIVTNINRIAIMVDCCAAMTIHLTTIAAADGLTVGTPMSVTATMIATITMDIDILTDPQVSLTPIENVLQELNPHVLDVIALINYE